MLNKEEEIKQSILAQNQQISKVSADTSTLNNHKAKYDELIADLNRIENKLKNEAERKNTIPNLLNQIMANIPDKVQLVSIENTTDKHISINAKSYDYQQLGYFIATVKTKKILFNAVTSSTVKTPSTVTETGKSKRPPHRNFWTKIEINNPPRYISYKLPNFL